MLSIIKRILRLSGKYRFRVIAGLIFNALKSCCAAFVFFAVLLVMLNIEHLTSAVIWQAFGIIALSVLGRFLFQYLSDVLMSASGYKIFREKRLEIGNQLKRAPIGYFTENNLGTVQTVLTTTISDLEGNCMLALTFLVRRFCSGTCHDIDVERVLLADWAFSFSRNFSGNFCVRTDKKSGLARIQKICKMPKNYWWVTH